MVDFADIRKEFNITNKAYFDELQAELGDEVENYSNLFKTREEIESEIADIKELLFHFDTSNAEVFQQQVSKIQDKPEVQALKKALGNARSLYNLIRLQGDYDLLEKCDFEKLNLLYREVCSHLDLINLKEHVANSDDLSGVLNEALENIFFMFQKVSEEELVLSDQLKDALRKTREAMASNIDHKDPEFISLREELERLFKKKNLTELSQENMNENLGSLAEIRNKIDELNRQNDLLEAKYKNDPKYVRTHKRLLEAGMAVKESDLFAALSDVKEGADAIILDNSQIMENDGFFNTSVTRLVIDKFKNEHDFDLNAQKAKAINRLIVNEYMNEYNGVTL